MTVRGTVLRWRQLPTEVIETGKPGLFVDRFTGMAWLQNRKQVLRSPQFVSDSKLLQHVPLGDRQPQRLGRDIERILLGQRQRRL